MMWSILHPVSGCLVFGVSTQTQNTKHKTQRPRCLPIGLCLSLVLAGPKSSALAQNFTCADPSLAAVAERARERSSAFWLGTPLTARWSTPCPIHVNSLAGPGWGNTQFTFAQGEVFGWRMQVRGTRQDILDDVLPHEVDHMVRASLTRRPIVRWLDEGCASLFESSPSHQHLREMCRNVDPSTITADWLNATDYPASAHDRDQLYALGFSLTEFLLDQRTPQQILKFQKDPRRPSDKLPDHFGLTPEQLQHEWTNWHTARRQHGTSCQAVGCMIHCPLLPPAKISGAADNSANRLVIWTSRWCGPCRTFWADWDRDAAFREKIQSKFQVQIKDVVLSPREAAAHNISSVPSFELADRRITGYQGTEWLLQQLGLADATNSPPAIASPSTKPANSDETASVSPPQTGQSPTTPPTASRSPSVKPDEWKATPPPARKTAAGATSSSSQTASRRSFNAGPFISFLLSILSLTGLLGPALATGGLGGIAVTLITFWLRTKLAAGAGVSSPAAANSSPTLTRKLDEAQQLLALRQSEGGASPLDALRGMFLNDELDKLAQSTDPAAVALASQLKSTINQRIEEVAPLIRDKG